MGTITTGLDLYPYQRLALVCGCHEIVTGPGAIDGYRCREHINDGEDPLLDARMDCFVHSKERNAAAVEREECAKLAERVGAQSQAIHVEIIAEVAAAIRARSRL